MSHPSTTTGSYIEVDHEAEEGSDYESSCELSTTQSMTESINKYFEENGRRYHAYFGADKHMQPIDESELERLDSHHEAFRLMCGGLYSAPLENPQRVLDLGTGTGIWCIDFADENPQAEVTGVDLSPIQPDWVPPNCKFEVDDVELEWMWPADTYDFIHMRTLLSAIKDIPKLLERCYNRLRPGGWVELGDMESVFRSDDNSIPPNWPPTICAELCLKASIKMGCSFWVSSKVEKFVKDAGFVDVKAVVLKQPFGPWCKDKNLKAAGSLMMISAETGFHAYGLALFSRVLGMSPEEALKICDDARDACLYRQRKEKVHQYSNYYKVWGRKPE